MKELQKELERKIKVSNKLLWEDRIKSNALKKWLNNFEGELPDSQEKIHALYMLSCFMYFGNKEMRELLKVLYNEFFKYPIISRIRSANNDTCDAKFIMEKFDNERTMSRFLGVGNPSESGCHLLYFFRQENVLEKELFSSEAEIIQFNRNKSGDVIGCKLRNPKIKRYVFIDDFCGSGQQVKEYVAERASVIKQLNSKIELWYCILFASSKGLKAIRDSNIFDKVIAVCELDDSYKCFQSNRYFQEYGDKLNKEYAKQICLKYGQDLFPENPLGYRKGEYLIGFYHNIPDNSLPIIWSDGNSGLQWHPIFKRYPKIGFTQ